MKKETRILTLPEIKTLLRKVDLMPLIREGFEAYSADEAVIPPVGELILDDPPGDVHIKYGYLLDDDYYVVKIASGFSMNRELGIPTSNGIMLLFSQHTGEVEAILMDEGHLTDIRTAVAGAIAAQALAPDNVECIGIVGTGMQARLQARYLSTVTECDKVMVWGRTPERLENCVQEMSRYGFDAVGTDDLDELGQTCNLIVTTTPATSPLLDVSHIRPGTHITAMGSDTEEKQELTTALVARADILVADSIDQCIERGEISHALRDGSIEEENIIELGALLSGVDEVERGPDDITIADLTGVAVQDIQIAKAVYLESL